MTNRLADYAPSGLSVCPAVRLIKKLLLYSMTIFLILQRESILSSRLSSHVGLSRLCTYYCILLFFEQATRAWTVERSLLLLSSPPPPPTTPVAGRSAARRHDSAAFAAFPHDGSVEWPRRPGRPVDVTTDAINDLGVKILDRYVQYQRGNVAFSPSGLGFVLVALYEGAAGSSAREISEVLGLPRDRRLTRIGLRDIHRRLRSYLNADAFLGGLTLNREDINLREDYERILRFYGFDVSDSAMENNETTSLSGNGTDSSNENSADEVETLPPPPPPPSTKLTEAGSTVADSGTTASSSPVSNAPSTSASFSPVTVVPTDAPTTSSRTLTTSNVPTTASSDPTVIDAPTSGTPITNDTVATTTTTSTLLTAATIEGDTVTSSLPRRRRGIFHGPLGFFSASPSEEAAAAAAAAAAAWLDEEGYGRLNDNEDYPSGEGDREDSRRSTEIVFLVNGCDYSRVTGATYTAFLPFSHFASLRASLLEFPLDDPRYKILVMLPSEATNGTRDLARTLATRPMTLRKLRGSLGATWLTAVVPSFMLRGFVTLTPYLQRLGISDVFDPRAADLTPMSPDLGVYARDVQQSIGLNIRNNAKSGRNGGAGGRGIGGADGGDEEQQRSRGARQPDSDELRSADIFAPPPPFFLAGGRPILPRFRAHAPYPSYSGPPPPYERGAPPVVPFVVDRPFLYFIVDDETSVTILAGRIDDPLNSRVLL